MIAIAYFIAPFKHKIITLPIGFSHSVKILSSVSLKSLNIKLDTIYPFQLCTKTRVQPLFSDRMSFSRNR